MGVNCTTAACQPCCNAKEELNCCRGFEESQILVMNGMQTQKIKFPKKHQRKLEKSCIKIQAIVRGHQQRKKFQYLKLFHNNGCTGINLIMIQEIPKSDSKLVNYIEKKLLPLDTAMNIIDQRGSMFGTPSKDSTVISNNQYTFKAKVILPNGSIYSGQWDQHADCKEGFGVQIWPDGSKYEGIWHQGKAQGKGRFILADGEVYEGEWSCDKAHGFGKYFYQDGAYYEGQWINDKQEGEGKEAWPDGSSFNGQYKNGKKNGKGEFLWPDGARYIGNWINNKMEGKGLFTWPDGRRYEGNYRQDKKNGFGIFHWPDGRVYEGEWEDGKQNGKGKLVSEKGNIQYGIWKNGKIVTPLDQREFENNL